MGDCLFCKIVRHEIPSRIVYEDDRILAFKDVNPAAPVHILVIPKEHISSITALREEHKELVGEILLVISKLANETSIAQDGFRVVINAGPRAGQSVQHIHFHLLGGRELSWPPG